MASDIYQWPALNDGLITSHRILKEGNYLPKLWTDVIEGGPQGSCLTHATWCCSSYGKAVLLLVKRHTSTREDWTKMVPRIIFSHKSSQVRFPDVMTVLSMTSSCSLNPIDCSEWVVSFIFRWVTFPAITTSQGPGVFHCVSSLVVEILGGNPYTMFSKCNSIFW